MSRAQLPAAARDDLIDETAPPDDLAARQRLAGFDWAAVAAALDDDGCALLPGLLSGAECGAVAALYAQPADSPRFRSRVRMQQHGFGRGEYRYFAYPLPPLLAGLRGALYERLLACANSWQARLGRPGFATTHAAYLAQCHAAGQARPTPLLSQYEAGDYNALHQDRYGELLFPLQVVVLLSAPGRDFEGGELVLTEQRPRLQSRPIVLPLRQGDAAVIAVDERPVQGRRGASRVRMRHGVSRVRSGRRHSLGIIFHDAA